MSGKPMPAQAAFPGMEPPVKARPLWLLYLDAAAGYWGPIAERLASERNLGPEGLQERDFEGIPEFQTLEEFRAELERRGVPFKE